jgi:hypothetical protein
MAPQRETANPLCGEDQAARTYINQTPKKNTRRDELTGARDAAQRDAALQEEIAESFCESKARAVHRQRQATRMCQRRARTAGILQGPAMQSCRVEEGDADDFWLELGP